MRLLRYAALLALACAHAVAAASGLQVSPVTLTLQPAQNADGLWLSNTGDNVVHAQVRVYHWTQENGVDKLTPSRGLLVSPPVMQLPVSDRQLIRVIRADAPAGVVEGAYRVIIDELPVEVQDKRGLQLVLRYSVPIFIAAAGAQSAAPQLKWSLHREGVQAVLEVANSGGMHAQLADLNFVDSGGRRTQVHAGLMGYVLPGARMRWPLKSSAEAFALGGVLETMINGNATQENIPPLERVR
ncbi:fimbria/pilus periplasmic chaperone [Variovorax sp. J22G21]|uniref:fimbrial biogenesis chaperone n=1 Tax=Variovorax fucosicus TaxID=3053517 RepID=UPI002577EC63|nr:MULTISPECIES: fimbria/pilus periplasmic chaperone [unclassified Variovorax]MDM0037700.1 fimbria/pilus periplasmic chaperone [Variovorax sp. J22R193]MDM0062476.1 fimbria/pilus periplasmic chaperone [Variovorax sp. J22G21]